jgi:uncharacterized protein YkwD
MGKTATLLRTATAGAILALAACSGGGSSSPLPTAVAPTPLASATAQPTVATSGVVYDLPYNGTSSAPGYSVIAPGVAATPGSPIAGADVYVGPELVLGAIAPATAPTGVMHAVTAANGSFTIGGLTPGTYALTIFAPAPHTAVLHQDLVVSASSASGTYFLTAPTTTETAWFAQQTLDRAAFDVAPLVLDESALEAARYWASFMARNDYFGHCIPESSCVAGDTTPPPASYGPQDVNPQARFTYFHGFSGGNEGENIAAGYATWQAVDQAFMAEQSACPGDTATGCPFTDATGHFLNIIDANYAWTGVAIATDASGTLYYDEEFTLVSTTLPSSKATRALHPIIPGRRSNGSSRKT